MGKAIGIHLFAHNIGWTERPLVTFAWLYSTLCSLPLCSASFKVARLQNGGHELPGKGLCIGIEEFLWEQVVFYLATFNSSPNREGGNFFFFTKK